MNKIACSAAQVGELELLCLAPVGLERDQTAAAEALFGGPAAVARGASSQT
ncbi:hypothetical protein [Enhygromyxa salina]|uniref:hypothetical protein n=1 Tax=Enhygromyxa salina TaxID=215803 RepID=UPI0015E79DA6|nr:hypothetical protein [Enhygromyxa salina]